MRRTGLSSHFAMLCVICLLGPAAVAADRESGSIRPVPDGETTRVVYVSPDGRETTIGVTSSTVSRERAVLVPDAGVLFATWDETSRGRSEHRGSVSLDGGSRWSRPRLLRYDIPLRAGTLVPGASAPPLPAELRARPGDRLFVVQFETMGLEAWRRILSRLGAEVLSYLPEHAHVVRMGPALVPAVAAQPFVRWVGPYEPGYKIEPGVLSEITASASCASTTRRYHLQTFRPGPAEKALLASEVVSAGGTVVLDPPHGYRLDAVLSLEQVVRIARSEHLLWLDRWSPPENDMDIVREQDGADYIESVAGYSGQGVRGEVMDGGVETTHMDFDGIQIHGPAPGLDSHGTATYGIVFGNGDRDGDGDAKATGNLPSKEAGYFYDYDSLTDRYQETEDLVTAPIHASFQSNSWGDARTRSYTSISSEMDDIIWLYDIPIFQSQSNAGNQDSRPQAWAKNIISIGGVYHYDTQTLSDDCWCYGGSTGPAEDGRIKPDLAYWYDWIYTTTTGNSYTSGFGGTSAATPVTAGIGGLILEMWADNVLGNNPEGTTVFEKRPHASTTKAMMINTAEPYPFSGTTSDLTRMHQGWGLPSARRFYDRRALLKVVDETEVLQELDTHTWTATVPAGQTELKVTLVYTDRAGTTSSMLHRINDVTLKVTDPGGGTFWYGNNGLEAGNGSVPGGEPDTKNTVENVFIESPAAGSWTIEISADDLNQDEHAETPEVDQDYALVVYGADSLTKGCAVLPPAPEGLSAVPAGDNRIDLSWAGTPTARRYRVYRSLGGCSGTYAMIGEAPKTRTTFTDTSASGGNTYGYVVRALEGCESADSNCAEVVATGPCILAPAFAGIGSAVGNDAASCGVTLEWPPAAAGCGGPVVYNVYRSSGSGFVPSAQNRIASCTPSTTFIDDRNLASNRTYYYVVRAEDLGGQGSATCGGASDSNLAAKSALVRGPSAVLLDTSFESGLEGWQPALGTPPASKGDFVAGTPTPTTVGGQPAQPGTCAGGTQCLFTGVNKGNNPDTGDVDDGEVLAASPVFDASGYATARLALARWHFNSATVSDGGDRFALDVSNDGGSTWTNLETLGAMASANSWTQEAFDLERGVALTGQMRLRVRSADGPIVDSTVESAIDEVHVDGALNCSTVVSQAPGAVAPGSLRVEPEGGKLRLAWGADCGGGTGYGIYRGDLSLGYASAAPLAGFCGVGTTSALVDPGPDSYFFLVAPTDGSTEGSLGMAGDGAPRGQPAQVCFPRANPVHSCAQ